MLKTGVPPLLHFYDEVTGVWGQKSFRVTSKHGSSIFQAVLVGCRRTQFVVENHLTRWVILYQIAQLWYNYCRGSWLRDKCGDFWVAWPGTYILSQGGELRMLEKEDSHVNDELV